MDGKRSGAGMEAVPNELKSCLTFLDEALTNVESTLHPLLSVPRNEINELSPLDQAKLDMVAVYSLNSLFWSYLNTCGINPKEHGVKQELDRIRSYMTRIKEIEDKAKAPKLDKKSVKRFVKSALWQAAQKKSKVQDENAEGNKDEKFVACDSLTKMQSGKWKMKKKSKR